ncbi:hypothetical protein FJZ39_00255 [Candidatus Saccharibacteria bacterium]|nr:hypothetical protein [Candidatus Saccharibacteria bacterium]
MKHLWWLAALLLAVLLFQPSLADALLLFVFVGAVPFTSITLSPLSMLLIWVITPIVSYITYLILSEYGTIWIDDVTRTIERLRTVRAKNTRRALRFKYVSLQHSVVSYLLFSLERNANNLETTSQKPSSHSSKPVKRFQKAFAS